MSPAIAVIQTIYRGYRFRSQLEAKWAFFFDMLQVEWVYEPEGFTVHTDGRSVCYLPDFYLPATDTWVEVKGWEGGLRTDAARIETVIREMGRSGRIRPDSAHSLPGLLLLGPVPEAHAGLTLHPIVVPDASGNLAWAWAGWVQQGMTHAHLTGASCESSDDLPREWSLNHWPVDPDRLDGVLLDCNRAVAEAQRQARFARFDHGDVPRPSLHLGRTRSASHTTPLMVISKETRRQRDRDIVIEIDW